ncbi:hypothetical protein CEUSTIGMA_g705.t1 [Chlamydomonas eustigma]|uniref:Uncharacterized protein n=1 Tax=Chlamydomonas eustigma TaxID=1157962 RepID=A0A250WR32_9CHLO|nr:hypothetical protein CEUSTIGMA_g705.t1 [Chlamydomonas eustigma]|eukprot:GAX73251.1 hypothetical protein CEUSTIGMA_g705.t1 [Chlamydomonas eustigma]
MMKDSFDHLEKQADELERNQQDEAYLCHGLLDVHIEDALQSSRHLTAVETLVIPAAAEESQGVHEKHATSPQTEQSTDETASESKQESLPVQNHGPGQACGVETSVSSLHPFQTDPGDHAETPFEAYQHIEPLLGRVARRLNVDKACLKIYDPYYCEGCMLQHMEQLGFMNVYNRNEDFYAVCASGQVPEFDVLVTNPPFSGDHLERIFEFAVASKKPWMLLMPQYVARKAFYLEWLNNRRARSGACKPVFLGPALKPYEFQAPASKPEVLLMRSPEHAANTDPVSSSMERVGLHEECSTEVHSFKVAAGSFQCVWFLSMGGIPQQAATVEWWRKNIGEAAAECVIVTDVKELPQLMAAPKSSPAERRWKKKQEVQLAGGETTLDVSHHGADMLGSGPKQGRGGSSRSSHTCLSSAQQASQIQGSRRLQNGKGKTR